MIWIGLDFYEGRLAVVPYPWDTTGKNLSDIKYLAAIESDANIRRAFILRADDSEEAMEIAIETLRIHAEARKNRLRGRGISVNKKEDNDGGLMYQALINLIDNAMRINGGVQIRASEYLNISPRSLNYHLQTYPELQKWCPKYNKVMRLAK